MPKRTPLDGQTVTLIVGIIVALFIALSALLYKGAGPSETHSSSPANDESRTSQVIHDVKSGLKKVVVLMSYVK